MDWCAKKGEDTSFTNNQDPSRLDTLVSGWILDLKMEDGSDYEPGTISSFHKGLANYFKEKFEIDLMEKKLLCN